MATANVPCPNCHRQTEWNNIIVCGQCGRQMCGACRAELTRESYHCLPCGIRGSFSHKPSKVATK